MSPWPISSSVRRFLCCSSLPLFPCKNHGVTARSSCTCGLDTLRDGSLDFNKIEEDYLAVLCSEEPSSAELFRNETEIAAEYDQQQEGSSLFRVGNARAFSYDELYEATDSFSSSRKLGDGGYGSVYLGKLKDGQLVAVKVLHKNNDEQVEQFINELIIFCSLHHKSLVTLHGCTPGNDERLLVYEYVPNGTVADHLHGSQGKTLTWDLRIQIAIETAEALAYLHFDPKHPSIIHCDVKTDNILLDNNFHVKVGDFGLCKHYVSEHPGTQGYLDPEYDKFQKLTDKSDVYSFGVVLLELISGKKAVDVERDEIYLVSLALSIIGKNKLEQLVDKNLDYQSDPEIRRMINLAAELACWCLEPEGNDRPPMVEVVMCLKRIRGDIDGSFSPRDETSPSPPDEISPMPNVSNLLPLWRFNLEDNRLIERVEDVRSTYGHKSSSIILFMMFKSPDIHPGDPLNHALPWGKSCGCRLYMKNNRILDGLMYSGCFSDLAIDYVITLGAINRTPPEVVQRILAYLRSLRSM